MALQSKNKTFTGARKRQAKAMPSQIDFMVDYTVQNPHVATGKFQILHGKSDSSASWEKLAQELNKMWDDSKTKDMKSWKSTWRDNKTLVSQKVAKIRANRASTGNLGGPPVKLTERDQKVLSLMGYDYVEGVESPDSFSEEHPNVNKLLAEGLESVLEIHASYLTVRSTSEISNVAHYTDYDVLDELLEGIDDTELPVIKEKSIKRRKTIVTATETEVATLYEPDQSSSKPMTAPGLSELESVIEQKRSSLPRRTSNGAKRRRDTLGTQLQDARVDFADLTERQVACMEIFAKTMQQIADNDEERNEILRTLAESQKTRDDAFSKLAVILEESADVLQRR